LIQVLLGMTQPSTKIAVHNLAFFDSTLNTSQKEAVKFALEAPEVACIHGPPGVYYQVTDFVSLGIDSCDRDRENTYTYRNNPTVDKRYSLKSKTETFTSLWSFQPLRRQHLRTASRSTPWREWRESEGDTYWSSR
jgi:hypothetical protein